MRGAVAVGAVGALAFAALSPTGAGAAVPAGTTDAPELLSATLEPSNEIGVKMQVIYCFDQPLASVGNLWWVKTYDSGRELNATSATINVDTKCANVNFPPTIDLKTQGSVALVNDTAVASNGVRSYPSSVPLTGSTLAPRPGQTTGPDLTAAVPQSDVDTVQFTFDQAFDATGCPGACASVDWTLFGAVDDSGVPVMGTSVVNTSLDATKITIKFPSAVNTKSRFFVEQGAVRTNNQTGTFGGFSTDLFTYSPDGVVVAAPISRPSLIAAEYESNGSWLFTYDQAVNPTTYDPTQVRAVFDNGNVEPAIGFNAVNSNTKQMHVTFSNTSPVTAMNGVADGGTAAEPTAVVRMISGNGAARVFNAPGAFAPVSYVDLTTAPMTAGRTTGPDLTGMSLDGDNNRAYYYFDEPVKNASALAGNYRLLIANGTGVDQIPSPSVSGTQVTVNYPAQFATAKGVTVYSNAAQDFLGQPNASSSAASAPPTNCTVNCNPGPITGPGSVECNTATGALAAANSAVASAQAKVAKLKKKAKKAKGAKKKKAKGKLKKAKGKLKTAQTNQVAAQATKTAKC